MKTQTLNLRKLFSLTTVFVLTLGTTFNANAQWKDLLEQLTDQLNVPSKTAGGNFGGVDIASGLKEALNKGIEKQVKKLTSTDGFYRNQAVKILMPEELQRVERTLRSVGLGSLADKGVKSLNRAAEDAVKTATPIFVTAVKTMSFNDAKNILLGDNTAATTYLQSATSTALYGKFQPVVQESIGKVGADVIWSKLIARYNAIPLVTPVNPDITDYVTNKAMEGVFKMIAVEEKNIRGNITFRTSDLLKKTFALQDKK